MVELARIIEPLARPAGGIESRGFGIVGQHLFGRLHREVAIARQIMLRKMIMPEPGGIVVAEPIAPVVPVTPVLGLSRDRFERSGVGAKTKIAPAEINRRRAIHPAGAGTSESFPDRLDGSAAVAIGAIHPIVQTVVEPIQSMLLVALAEAGEEGLPFVGPAVAI